MEPPFLISLEVGTGYVTIDTVQGQIEDIRFQNITVTSRWTPRSRIQGYNAGHTVQRVAIDNLCINGKKVASLEAGGFELNEFVKDITLN
jgi:hemolysin activation/secretion protein